MASDNEASCESDPNFAVICSFMEKFSALCGINDVGFLELQEMLENTEEVPQELIDLHIKLLRKSRKSVSNERWEKAVVKFCHNLCTQDAYEIERFGYKNARLSSKLRVLKELLEMQFDFNAKFKNEINKMSAEELRTQPLGRDKLLNAYWFQRDKNFEIRVYKEDPDEETWTLVARDRDGLSALITELSDGDSKVSSESEKILEEDSNSLAEKPIIDTGQNESSSSDSNKKIDESDEDDVNNDTEDISEVNVRTKHGRDDDDDNDDDNSELSKAKKPKIDNKDDDEEVSEEIEEPLMLVTGKGSGTDNESPNPIVGEVIEEAVMYFYGNGNGDDCQTGNDKNEKSLTKTENQSKNDEVFNNSDKRTSSSSKSSDCASNNIINSINNDERSSQIEVPTSPFIKCPYKLGTIIDTKTDNKFFNSSIKSPTKKSRWDVETKIIKSNDDEILVNKDQLELGEKENVNKLDLSPPSTDTECKTETPKKSLFFFGPGCLSFKSNANPVATMGFGQKVPTLINNDNNVKLEKFNVNKVFKECENNSTEKNSSIIIQENTQELKEESLKTIDCLAKSDDNNQDETETIKEENVSSIDNENTRKQLEDTILIDKTKEYQSKHIEDTKQEHLQQREQTKEPKSKTETITQQEDENSNKKLEVETPFQSVTATETSQENKPIKDVDEENSKESKTEDAIVQNELKHENLKQETKENIVISTVKGPSEEKTECVKLEEEINENSKVNKTELNLGSAPNKNAENVRLEHKRSKEVQKKENIEEDKSNTKIGVIKEMEQPQPVEKIEETEKNEIESCREKIKTPEVPIEAEQEIKKPETAIQESEIVEKVNKNPETKLENLEETNELTETLTFKKDTVIVPEKSTKESEKKPIEVVQSNINIESEKIQKAGENFHLEKVQDVLEKSVTEEKTKRNIEIKLEKSEKGFNISEILKPDKNLEIISEKLPEDGIKQSVVAETAEENIESDLRSQSQEEVKGLKTVECEVESYKMEPEKLPEEAKSSEIIENVENLKNKPGKASEETKITKTVGKAEDINLEKCKKLTKAPATEDTVKNPVEISQKTQEIMEINQHPPKKRKIDQIFLKFDSKIENENKKDENNKKATSPTGQLNNISHIKDEAKNTLLEAGGSNVTTFSKENKKEVKVNEKEDAISLVPVVEEACVKKNAYVCGQDETDKEKTESIEDLDFNEKMVETRGQKDKEQDPDQKESPEKLEKQSLKKNKITKKDNVQNDIDIKPTSEDSIEENKNKEEEKDIKPLNKKTNKCKNESGVLRRGRSRGLQSKDEQEDDSKKSKLTNDEATNEIKNIEEIAQVKDESTDKKNELNKNNASKDSLELKKEETLETTPPIVEGNTEDNVCEIQEKDPLANLEEENNTEPKTTTLSTFSLDFNESPIPVPIKNRKRSHEMPPNTQEISDTPGKRMKMKGKRTVNAKLRKSIEEKRQELISSDDDAPASSGPSNESTPESTSKLEEKGKSPKKGGTEEQSKADETPKNNKQKKSSKNRILQSLGIDPDVQPIIEEGPATGVRQSRRIAQLKIKEEAERRKLEEEMLKEAKENKKEKKTKDKDYKFKRKNKSDDEDDEVAEAEEPEKQEKKKRKKKKKDPRKLFDESNPWKSSSDSDSESHVEEEEEEELYDYDEPLQFKSDHEFSPESDLEDGCEFQPLKRARTVKKESDVEVEVDDCPCQKCGKSDHPEWILLCDKCDNGWHCSCLRPPLLIIPEGDWYCPPCQHNSLLQNLQEKLKEYDKTLRKRELDLRRKERLAYVGISLNNVLPSKEEHIKRKKHKKSDDVESAEVEDEIEDDNDNDHDEYEGGEVGGEESESSEEGSSGEAEEETSVLSESDSDEPIYQLRERRQAHSYRFNDYDELINSAIQEDMDKVPWTGNVNQSRGKDIATIVKEIAEKETVQIAPLNLSAQEPLPPVVPREEEPPAVIEDHEDNDDEVIKPVKKKLIGRKKPRKLNSLDDISEDEDSDEDFKGTSSESEDEFEVDDLESEDSSDLDTRRGKRRNIDSVRRSTRARTSRYDADFIDDAESEEEEVEEPRKKKKKSIWDESESEESDRSWGRRKKKPKHTVKSRTQLPTPKKRSKKKKKNEDSDVEVFKKKKPKIKFGSIDDGGGTEGGEEGRRRTRGKKINFVDALGSDSDEDNNKVKRAPPRIESEEEYVANEEELDDDEKASDDERSIETKQVPKIIPNSIPTVIQSTTEDDVDDEPNPIDVINKNLEEMDENEMEKMMEEEDYANKQLQLVALQLEKEKKRKEREAEKLKLLQLQQQQQQQQQQQPPIPTIVHQTPTIVQPTPTIIQAAPIIQPTAIPAQSQPPPPTLNQPKKRGRKPKNQLLIQEKLNSDSLVNPDNNDELSEPPGVSLALFEEMNQDESKRRNRGRSKKEEGDFVGGESNIEIAAPPQPFSQSQPTPSVITRMLQNKPGQPGYPVGVIRPKQFAAISEDEANLPPGSHHNISPGPSPTGQYHPALRPSIGSPFRQAPPPPPPGLNHFPPRTHPSAATSPQLRATLPPTSQALPHLYHPHRSLDPSPSGGGQINISGHNSPNRVASPGGTGSPIVKNDTPPPPYSRPSPVTRFTTTPLPPGAPHRMHLIPPSHIQPRPNISPFNHGIGSGGPGGGNYYGTYPPMTGTNEESYQNLPPSYSESFEGPSENSSNSKSYDEESAGGEFGGLVSYFSSQREDDLES